MGLADKGLQRSLIADLLDRIEMAMQITCHVTVVISILDHLLINTPKGEGFWEPEFSLSIVIVLTLTFAVLCHLFVSTNPDHFASME